PEDGELQRKMGKNVADMAAFVPRRRKRCGSWVDGAVLSGAPRARRNLAHSTQQALLRAFPKQHRTVGPYRNERRSAALRALGPGALYGEMLRVAATQRQALVLQGTDDAGRSARRAHGRTEIHHRLREITRPKLGCEALRG